MRRRVNLQSFPFGSSGNALIPMNGLPADDRLIRLDLHMPFVADQAAAAGAVVTGNTIQRFIDRVVQGRRINGVSGQGLNALAWAQTGRDPSICADIPAADGNYDRILNLALHFADYDSASPLDTAPLCGLLRDTELAVNFGSVVALSTLTSVTGTLRTTAVTEKAPKGAIATPILLDEYEQTGELNLPPGNYSHLVAFKPDGTPFTTAEIASLTVYLDSIPYVDSQSIPQLAAAWNQDKAVGGDTQALSATVPVAGEAITEQPGVAAGAGPAVSVGPFLPLLVPPHGYSITKPFRAENKVRVVWTGSLTTMRVIARRLEELTDDQVIRAGAKVGIAARSARAATQNGQDFPAGTAAWVRRLSPRIVG